MRAIIWGSSGSLPTPLTSSSIQEKMKQALWEAREQHFASMEDVDRYLNAKAHSFSGTYKGNTSCVQIEATDSEVIFCDAGSGLRDYALALGRQRQPKTYHIFLSHLHWDHIQGLPFFTPAYEEGNHLVFHSMHDATEQVLRTQMDGPTFPVPFDQLKATIEFDIQPPESRFQIGELNVETIAQSHPGESFGYAFSKDGKRIVYSSDSEHGPEAKQPDYKFINFFKNADVLIIDGQYTPKEALNEKRDWGHSDPITAVELASRAEARKLVIFHHEPNHSDTMIEGIRKEAIEHLEAFRRANGDSTTFPVELLVAYDGLVINA